MSSQTKYILPESELPRAWYNLRADLPFELPPVLHPGTMQPVGPADLAPLYPRWADFPATPTDLPQPAQIAANVGALNADSSRLATQVAGIDWTMDSDPTAFVESIQQRFDPARMAPIGAE